MQRRKFIKDSFYLGSALFLGSCGNDPIEKKITKRKKHAIATELPKRSIEGGEKTATFGFINEGDIALNVNFGIGLGGRRYTDLSLITKEKLITPNHHFFVRTGCPDKLNTGAPWKIDIEGMINRPGPLFLSEFAQMEISQGVHVMECAGNQPYGGFGLLSAADWDGIPLSGLVEYIRLRMEIQSSATRVLISGFDERSKNEGDKAYSVPGAGWICTFDEIESSNAFLATRMNGVPLPNDNGFPLRLVIPGWYAAANIKWVNKIVFVDDKENATSQMREYATRTHQVGTPKLARDYKPAVMNLAAMPIRIEKWKVKGEIIYRIAGIMWGGEKLTKSLQLCIGEDEWDTVDFISERNSVNGWSLWTYLWKPIQVGVYDLFLRATAPSIKATRLSAQYYKRRCIIDEI